MTVEWRDVPGYEGRYRVSSNGQVMSHVRLKSRLRKTQTDRQGYARVMLVADGRKALHGVHRLVALAFLADSQFPGAVVCHNDGDQTNNAVENLRWATVRENNLDLIKHGKHNWQQAIDKTHCIRGHEFAGSNLRIAPDGDRICRACEAIRRRKFKANRSRGKRIQTSPTK